MKKTYLVRKAPEGKLANVVCESLKRQGISIKDLADKIGTSYEHARKIVRGEVVPSKHILVIVSRTLGLDLLELEKLAAIESVTTKYGKILSEIYGIDHDLESLERWWPALTSEQKETMIQLAQILATRNGMRSK